MVMGWIWTGLIALSILSAALTGRGEALAAHAGLMRTHIHIVSSISQ